LKKDVLKGKLSEAEATEVLSRITVSTEMEKLSNADFVVEVFLIYLLADTFDETIKY
jgi:3-hydroxyacyl-CoA dehydrogenase